MIEIGGLSLAPGMALLVASAAIVGGFLRGFVGFGGALALVPALALALGPRVAVAVASVVGLPAVLQFLPEAVRHADRRRVVPIAVAIMAGAPLGSLILTTVSPRIMTGVIGVVVMLMALATWRTPGRHLAQSLWVNLIAGGLSGLLQGAAGIGGPPSVAVLMAQGGEPRRVRADVLAVTAMIAVCGAISHWWFGLFSAQVGIIALFILPLFVGFTWVGSRFFDSGGARHFRASALGVLLVIGVVTVIAALRGG